MEPVVPQGGFSPVAVENLSMLDADLTFIAYDAEEDRKWLEGLDVFQSIPSVANGDI